MKIDQLVRPRERRLSPLKSKVLQYLGAHPDEVFPYRDEGLAQQLGVKVSALSFTLWGLHQDGLIARETVDGKVYFGSKEAIRQLRQKGRTLPVAEEAPTDPLVRARLLRERIYKRMGDVDVLKWLDESREGHP